MTLPTSARNTVDTERLASVRSLLFIPAHKTRFLNSAATSGADAIILDLEDSVPSEQKQQARSGLLAHSITETVRIVRINQMSSAHAAEDLRACVAAEIDAVLMPKVESRDEVICAAWFLADIARKADHTPVPKIIASLETARAIWDPVGLLKDIPECIGLMAGAPQDGDVATDVGLHWTKEGNERLLIESTGVIAARALGLRAVWAFPWLNLDDSEDMIKDHVRQRNIGYTARAAIHPKHISSINSVFGNEEESVTELTDLIAALESASNQGEAAIRYKSRMVDVAHLSNARLRLQAQQAKPHT